MSDAIMYNKLGFSDAIENVALTVDNQIAEALTELTDEISDAVESAIDDAVRNISNEVASEIRDMLEERFDGRRKFNVHDTVKDELARHQESLTSADANIEQVEKIAELTAENQDLLHVVLMLEAQILKATDPKLGFFETAQAMGELRNLAILRQKERAETQASLA
jgi:hypothetical protein